jgi:DNA-binding CsgD family transcriptional regulator
MDRMAIHGQWKDLSDGEYRGKERRRGFQRMSDQRNAAVAALGEALIRRQWRAMFLVDEALTLILANGAAREAFEHNGWLRQTDRRIEVLDSALAQQVSDAMSDWPRTRSDSVVLISSDRRLELTLLRQSHHLPAVYVVTILEPSETPVDTGKVLTSAGLTDAQARVAVLIYEGCSRREVATKIDKTVNTVKSHLDGIYNKLGVRSERELTRWVADTLAHDS